MSAIRALSAACVAFLLLAVPALAQPPEPDEVGPKKIVLDGGNATLDLPEGFAYYGKAKTRKILEESEGVSDDSDIGIVVGTAEEDEFAIFLSYEKTGYVKDDEAGKLDAEAILKSLKEGTEAANEERRKRGIAELHVKDWAEAPRYDKAQHQVVWAVRGVGSDGEVINYNTRVLGREGVLSENLVTDPGHLDRAKPKVAEILAATRYNEGKRYEDYKPGDKVAEYGLMGLILGSLALSKGGIFKAILAFVLAFKKVIILGVVGLGAMLGKVLGRKS
ncbi:MAG: DUF2167 domain-containing protein [Candidatus Eremiobacterota bacterium]